MCVAGVPLCCEVSGGDPQAIDEEGLCDLRDPRPHTDGVHVTAPSHHRKMAARHKAQPMNQAFTFFHLPDPIFVKKKSLQTLLFENNSSYN